MSRSDVFALKNSSLNAFLLADIGEEINGSRLTILSALARLGKDPWDEAAKWDQEPKAHAIEALTANIIDMPLNHEAIQDARSIAARLIFSSNPTQRVLPNWMWMAILYPWVLLALNAGMALSHGPSPVTSTSTVQPSR
jgi:hypothetical protein